MAKYNWSFVCKLCPGGHRVFGHLTELGAVRSRLDGKPHWTDLVLTPADGGADRAPSREQLQKLLIADTLDGGWVHDGSGHKGEGLGRADIDWTGFGRSLPRRPTAP